jgi:hypothetical protein
MFYVFSSTKSENRSRSGGGLFKGEEVGQTMYTHVSKCKNNKIKERKKNTFFFFTGKVTLEILSYILL